MLAFCQLPSTEGMGGGLRAENHNISLPLEPPTVGARGRACSPLRAVRKAFEHSQGRCNRSKSGSQRAVTVSMT